MKILNSFSDGILREISSSIYLTNLLTGWEFTSTLRVSAFTGKDMGDDFELQNTIMAETYYLFLMYPDFHIAQGNTDLSCP